MTNLPPESAIARNLGARTVSERLLELGLHISQRFENEVLSAFGAKEVHPPLELSSELGKAREKKKATPAEWRAAFLAQSGGAYRRTS